jgi:hypothetical protein
MHPHQVLGVAALTALALGAVLVNSGSRATLDGSRPAGPFVAKEQRPQRETLQYQLEGERAFMEEDEEQLREYSDSEDVQLQFVEKYENKPVAIADAAAAAIHTASLLNNRECGLFCWFVDLFIFFVTFH